MIEEPYRWVEAIANRREYVETQLASGAAVVAVSCREGVLFATIGSSRQKIFEIYDRIAMGALGHPGDIERLRMTAIDLASTEGFTRSAADVSLRRLAYYSLSPALKSAFEQIYGAPYLARMLFAELGETPSEDLFLRVNFDGAIEGDRSHFGTLAGNAAADAAMQRQLAQQETADADVGVALGLALDTLAAADLAGESSEGSPPDREALRAHVTRRLADHRIETALLERKSSSSIRFRSIPADEAASMIEQP